MIYVTCILISIFNMIAELHAKLIIYRLYKYCYIDKIMYEDKKFLIDANLSFLYFMIEYFFFQRSIFCGKEMYSKAYRTRIRSKNYKYEKVISQR